jgi:hypothetical protein
VSLVLAGGVAGAYIAGIVGLHRLNVRRKRALSGGFAPLRWLDWDCLLAGLLPAGLKGAASAGVAVHGGGPSPLLLSAAAPPEAEARHALVLAVASGQAVDEATLGAAGFSGGQAKWLRTVSLVARAPDQALERLVASGVGSAAELYLRERLLLAHRTHALNLELSVFGAKRRLGLGLSRFGEAPELYFVRALASSLLGFNHAAINDLARAVYFSQQAAFYLRAVVETPYIDEARPALAQQCRLALYPPPT